MTRSPAPLKEPVLGSGADEGAHALRELLARAIDFSVAGSEDPALVARATRLSEAARDSFAEADIKALRSPLRDLWLSAERAEENRRKHADALKRLVKLMGHSLSDLVPWDAPLRQQLAQVQDTSSGSLDIATIKRMEVCITELLLKQGMRKSALQDAESALRDMVARIIERLAVFGSATGDYHGKLTRYAEQIKQSGDILQLGRVLENIMADTRTMQADAARGTEEMSMMRSQLEANQEKIKQLEQQLETVTEMVKEDPLTHLLNRRGLDDVFQVELARCSRHKVPLCAAMIDLDNFKKLNDTYGHQVGDAVLGHLAHVLKDTLRATDWIARYGGEEFVVLMPETDLANAEIGIERALSILRQKPLEYQGVSVRVTFSAGIAAHAGMQDEQQMLQRADRALYQAKTQGKNQVVCDRAA
jgi:diguanylate cyclase